MSKTVKVSSISPEIAPAFSVAVRAGQFLFISGQVARDADKRVVGIGDCEAQADHVFATLDSILLGAGATRKDIVKVTTFLVNPDDYPTFNRVRQQYFSAGTPPASSSVFVKALVHPDMLLEVEAIAFLPPDVHQAP